MAMSKKKREQVELRAEQWDKKWEQEKKERDAVAEDKPTAIKALKNLEKELKVILDAKGRTASIDKGVHPLHVAVCRVEVHCAGMGGLPSFYAKLDWWCLIRFTRSDVAIKNERERRAEIRVHARNLHDWAKRTRLAVACGKQELPIPRRGGVTQEIDYPQPDDPRPI